MLHRRRLGSGEAFGLEEFDRLYTLHSPMVYWTAYGMARSRETALDIVQTVFLKAYESWNKIGGLNEAQQKSWLYKTTRNAVIDLLRKEKREFANDDLPELIDSDESAMPEEAYVKSEQSRAIWQLVSRLPAIYRQPIVLHYFAELSQKEAAAALNIPGGTYRSRLSRGRALLEKAWKGEERYQKFNR